MSRTQRIALVAAALVVAVAAFVIAQPGDDDEPERSAATSDTADTGSGERTATEEETEPAPPRPEVTRVAIVGGQVQGGAKTIEATRGDTVRIVVRVDAPDELHLHGYDITRNAAPGSPARFRFEADAEGAFELESHVAEDAGRDPLVARVVVEPA